MYPVTKRKREGGCRYLGPPLADCLRPRDQDPALDSSAPLNPSRRGLVRILAARRHPHPPDQGDPRRHRYPAAG